MEKIVIETFNPYEAAFPNRLLVDRDTLRLAKYFRQNGFEVTIKGQDNIPVEYLSRKGIGDLFTDPIFITIATTILANVVSDLITTISKEGLTKERRSQMQKTQSSLAVVIVTMI